MPSKLSSPTFAVTAAILGGIALSIATCHGAVIDLFNEAPQDISRTNPSLSEVTDAVLLSNSLFETRSLELNRGIHHLTVNTSGPFLDYQTDPGEFAWNYFSVTWSSSSPVNLLADGATTLRLTFAEAATYPQFPFRVVLWSDALHPTSGNSHRDLDFHPANGVSHFDIPFSHYDAIDLTQVTSVTFDAFRIREDRSLRLLSITTIPEPGTPILSLFALSFFLRLRRRPPPPKSPITINQ